MIWERLTPGEAHGAYCVPKNAAFDSRNFFYGTQPKAMSNRFDMDGPWPLIAFLHQASNLNIVTLHLNNLFPEFTESENFNSLENNIGGLAFYKEELSDFIALLRLHSGYLPMTPELSSPIFQIMHTNDPVWRRFHPEWLPQTNLGLYRQLLEPLEGLQKTKNITIVRISRDIIDSPAPNSIYFSIASFSETSLDDPNFNPLDAAIARINLNRQGLVELSDLLESEVDFI